MPSMSSFESGPKNAKICLIGESPSWEEIRRNQPFVGPAGNLLDLCLHSAQLPRAGCYITNVFETMVKRPEKKGKETNAIVSLDGANLLWTGTKGFTPLGRILAEPCLQRITSCSANVLVPLGGTALSLCADSRSITKWRGSIFYGNADVQNRKLVPTIHPSAALRGVYEYRYFIINDLARAKEESGSPEVVPTKRELLIDPSHADCVSFLRACLDAPYVATDLEILGGQIDCLSLATGPERAISIPLLDHNFESRFNVEEERQIWDLYAQLMAAERVTKVNQNILFDLTCLMQLNGIIARGQIDDPMVAFSVMYPFLSKSLGTICSMMTREPYYKDDGVLQDSPSVEDFERRWEYNAKDSAIALESWLKLAPMLDENGYRKTYDMTMAMLPSLAYMMVAGVKLDEGRLLEARKETRRLIAEKVEQLSVIMGVPLITEAPKKAAEKRAVAAAGAINVNSTKQIANYFYRTKKLKPYVNHAGNETTDDLALARIFRRDGLQEAKLLQEYRALEKLCGTYLEVGYDRDRHVRCSYNIRGTMFGRLSSQQTIFGTGLNLQNLPADFRGFLVSEDYIAEEPLKTESGA